MDNFNKELEIKKFLTNIFKNYKATEDRNIEGHPISNIFNGFAKNLKKFANDNEFLKNSYVYDSKSVHIFDNDFVDNPYVYLQEVSTGNIFYIGYMFRVDLQGAYLALQLGKMTIDNDENPFNDQEMNHIFKEDFRKFFINTIRNEISKKTKAVKNFGKSAENIGSDNTTIYSKYYQRNNLPSEKQLKNDLIEISEIAQNIS